MIRHRSLLLFRGSDAGLTLDSVPKLWALIDYQFSFICFLVSALEANGEKCAKDHNENISSV